MLACLLYFITSPKMAQVKFTASVSFSSNCSSTLVGRVVYATCRQICEHINNDLLFDNCDECDGCT